mmetsp:Transcript_25296/g.55046  ORF Transcript_25296/g.55046 Transcript_25296/m.55046 type:complete len:336 (+) Transcript_25296:747-1754(+)
MVPFHASLFEQLFGPVVVFQSLLVLTRILGQIAEGDFYPSTRRCYCGTNLFQDMLSSMVFALRICAFLRRKIDHSCPKTDQVYSGNRLLLASILQGICADLYKVCHPFIGFGFTALARNLQHHLPDGPAGSGELATCQGPRVPSQFHLFVASVHHPLLKGEGNLRIQLVEARSIRNESEDAILVLSDRGLGIFYSNSQKGLPEVHCSLGMREGFEETLLLRGGHADVEFAFVRAYERSGDIELEIAPYSRQIARGIPRRHHGQDLPDAFDSLSELSPECFERNADTLGLRFFHPMLVDAEAAYPHVCPLRIQTVSDAKTLQTVSNVTYCITPGVA